MQRTTMIAAVLSLAALGGTALAQAPAGAPSGPAAEVLGAYNRVKANAIKAAEKMPAESYGFKPHPDIRTFARVVNHISEAQVSSCGSVLGTPAAELPKVPAETATKEEVLTALKASFTLCDKAYGSVTDANLADPIKNPRGTRARISVLWGNISHDNEQYAILSDYLRDKNLAPPTSEK